MCVGWPCSTVQNTEVVDKQILQLSRNVKAVEHTATLHMIVAPLCTMAYMPLCLLPQLKKQKAEEAAAQVAAEIEAREAEAAAEAAAIAAEQARQRQQVEVRETCSMHSP